VRRSVPYVVVEWTGAALVSVALGFGVDAWLGVGAAGAYLFGAALVAQFVEGDPRD